MHTGRRSFLPHPPLPPTLATSRITEHLGSGEFGTVCKGFWHTSKGSVEVAVKMVNRQVEKWKMKYCVLEYSLYYSNATDV